MQKTKGISLIVLVITIIVMIILAGAIIISLNNSGIIDKASNAVEKSDEATIKEIAQMAWAESYAEYKSGVNNLTEEALVTELEKDVIAALEANKVNTEGYSIKVTTKGVDIVKGWIQDGLKVKRGDDVLEIGSEFDYDETAEGTITGLTETGWKVLGAENGELLIMSTVDVVASHILGDERHGKDIDEAVNDYLNGVAELDGLCEPYGKGKNATGARSIRVEDVDKITGFDKTTNNQGTIAEYGNEVTYSYAGAANKIKYYSKVTAPEKEVDCSAFYYLDGTNKLVKADLANGVGIITKLKSSYYYYYAPELETIDKTSDAYTMIFGEYENEDTYYWLASPLVDARDSSAWFSMRYVDCGSVGDYCLWCSLGYSNFHEPGLRYEYGVRAVVSLASDVNITGSSASGWTY